MVVHLDHGAGGLLLVSISLVLAELPLSLECFRALLAGVWPGPVELLALLDLGVHLDGELLVGAVVLEMEGALLHVLHLLLVHDLVPVLHPLCFGRFQGPLKGLLLLAFPRGELPVFLDLGRLIELPLDACDEIFG